MRPRRYTLGLLPASGVAVALIVGVYLLAFVVVGVVK